MFYTAVYLCLVASALAAPAPTEVVPLEKQQPTVIPIVSQSEELEPNGTYKFSYETGNGIKREEISYDKVNPKAQGRSAADSNEGGESDESNEIHVQIGSYSYTAPDGTLISLRYIADENGFQPIGDHIPRIGGISAVSAERGSKSLKKDDSAQSESAPVSLSAKVESPEAPPEPESKSAKNTEKDTEKDAASADATSESTTIKATTEEKSGELTTEVSSELSTPNASSTEPVKTETPNALSTEGVNSSESSTSVAQTEAASSESSVTVASASESNSENSLAEAASTPETPVA